ncbi:hypothetical protein [Okeania sp. SIO1F9]|uniref:hypothetical protein n=1 Tax=Okeania sp. SIO1F9 TaxID=2607813 RepID=UPI00257CAFEF|nr:hypothetical protein [Okeania sp. SIO1F9]
MNRNKVKFSNNWKKAQLKIARLHTNVADIRKDTLHKRAYLFGEKPQPDSNRRP